MILNNVGRLNLGDIKRTMHHGQERFVLEIHCGLLLGSLLTNPISMSKKKNTIIFIDAKKVFVQISVFVLGRNSEKELRIKIYFLSLIKTICGQPLAKNMLNFVILEAFPLQSINEGWLLSTLLPVVVFSSQ